MPFSRSRSIESMHALGDVLVGAEGARLPEHGVDQRRLAVVDVGDDGDVADVLAKRAHLREASAMSDTPAHPLAAEHANPARAIYGTILVMAVITALSHDDSVKSAELIAGVLATTFVFWIAHVYAEVLGTSGWRASGECPRLANVAVAARGEWPLVEASLLPVLCLLLGVIGLVKTDTAVAIAIGAGVVELFGYGIAAGRRLESLTRRHHRRRRRSTARCGLLIVLLKVLVH